MLQTVFLQPRLIMSKYLDDLVFNLLDNMSQRFSWVPPQFAYADYR